MKDKIKQSCVEIVKLYNIMFRFTVVLTSIKEFATNIKAIWSK